ncbi:hypothetical protein G4Y73_05160 [Wenzhouxiangella sp. XN201]|nr:hypothetical protein [Wenzhouxiangella sp. XN201]NEZ03540.1 hypothetical protein [Wenzhouxiangella sp. XN201]
MEKPHRIDRLNRWLTFGANLGVVLGLIFGISAMIARINAELEGSS